MLFVHSQCSTPRPLKEKVSKIPVVNVKYRFGTRQTLTIAQVLQYLTFVLTTLGQALFDLQPALSGHKFFEMQLLLGFRAETFRKTWPHIQPRKILPLGDVEGLIGA
ncbi:hypothetical protein PENVUL_c001G02901 [Penicillium vulpinum]|uniref:Uncharacterized protein n=1 Tax=Penicillium vulpinum TaxID=29845 RepID=A0A1V6SF22_9EURO|nr:hypothetical protein PENVUL_c001G02901 [Penicillium vulpinum]